MSVAISTERRLLTEAEFGLVAQTHYPQIGGLERDDLAGLARQLREYRRKAQTIARQQRREMRGKAEPRGTRPARDNSGTAVKAQILSDALQRVNSELGRLKRAEVRASQSEYARHALELKRANRVQHHPRSGRTAGQGLQPNPSQRRTVESDPREVGRVSQFVKAAQARRDSRG